VSQDINLAAQSSATVVVFMGMSHLDEIIKTFQTHKSDDYPVAVVQHGTLPNERHIVSNLKNVVADVKEAGLGSPALIIVGNAVKEGVCKLINKLKQKEQVL
jgi:uroporphyrin-III C-methyltransferase